LNPFYVPPRQEFLAEIKAYSENETRGPVYFEASDRLAHNWGDHIAMTEAVGILLKCWHVAFYRFGMFKPTRLQSCILQLGNG
jgi:hypothetical protein